MVLFKRKPVQFVPAPVIDDTSQEVWLIGETGEIFTSYENYLARLDFYKQKRFICEITGHSSLSFFEAHRSETAGSKDVDETFPEALKEPVLRRVQFQTISRVDNLVDHIFDLFKQDFYPGETVMAFLPSGDRTEAVIREKIRLSELRNPTTNEVERRAMSRYVVKLPNRNGAEANVDDEQLVRDRKVFTKAMLRSFIKNTVSREAWTGAPWVVKEQYAKKYKIDSTIPSHLMRGLTAAARKAALLRRKEQEAALLGNARNPSVTSTPVAEPTGTSTLDIRPVPTLSKSHKSKNQQAGGRGDRNFDASSPMPTPERECSTNAFPLSKIIMKQEIKPAPVPKPPPPPVIKYPIEDLQIPPKPDAPKRPSMHFLSEPMALGPSNSDTAKFEEHITHYLLETWVYLNIYCEPFLLDSFTFDDYVDAIQFSTEDIDCELFVEVHCALLKSLVGEGDNGRVEISLPELEDEDEDDEDDSSLRQASEAAEDSVEVKVKQLSKDKPGDDEDVEMEDGDENKEIGHRAVELFEDGYDWIARLRRRDFKNGGWQVIVVGLLDQFSVLPKYAADADRILTHLVPPEEEPTQQTVRNQYITLDINLRTLVLHILVGLSYDASMIRKYMEECAEAMTEYRKKKIEHQRARKAYLEKLRSLEDERKILLPENTPRSASPERARSTSKEDADNDLRVNGTEDEDEVDETGEDTDNRRTLRRGDERANARKRKREEEKEKAEAAANKPKTSQQFQRVLKNIEKIRNKIAKEEEEIATIDEDLREADCARLRLLGKDRFFNRYWWFERNGMPFAGLPTSSTADAGYANGRLWVQGPSDMERQGFLEQSKPHEVVATGDQMDLDPKMPAMERKLCEEGETSVVLSHQFAFYETPEELSALISWLDSRGERELRLKKELELYRKKIVNGMEKRKAYLTPIDDASGSECATGTRMSTRGKIYLDPSAHRCLIWQNTTAVDELGHTHYDQPVKKPKGSRKSTGIDDKGAVNRNGKPLGRQGTRYNF
ncbi:ATP-utilizing chromatin assembly and remodelling N-terminal-domain-containing protein [Terfezia claveryi]|nr:ATP-utilizing chromatin assembly and remodelling N-terminal-domain-containing protein [Terfezia claveryi]